MVCSCNHQYEYSEGKRTLYLWPLWPPTHYLMSHPKKKKKMTLRRVSRSRKLWTQDEVIQMCLTLEESSTFYFLFIFCCARFVCACYSDKNKKNISECRKEATYASFTCWRKFPSSSLFWNHDFSESRLSRSGDLFSERIGFYQEVTRFILAHFLGKSY